MKLTACFTGHRPKAFPWGTDKSDPKCKILLGRLEAAIDDLISKGCTHFIAGNALGIDSWASEIVLEKKKSNPEITLEIAQPFEGHNERLRNAEQKKEIQDILAAADLVHPVSTRERRQNAYLDRNKYMVDHSDFVVAVFDDKEEHTGGTWYTLEYAMKNAKVVTKIQWLDLKA